MSSNISDVLKQLDTLNTENGFNVFVPSLKRTVKFKPLNLRQQKGLLKSSIDESLTKLSFNTFFFTVIKENILDTVNTELLYTFDRSAIALAFRAHGLDNFYKSDDKTYDLTTILNGLPSIDTATQPLNAVYEDSNIRVTVSAPTLIADYELNAFALNKTGTGTDDFKTVISELFVYELTKFISSIEIINDEKVTTINFFQTKAADRISIVEKLPSTLINKILDFIKSHREFEAKFTAIEDINIDIDGSFFTV
jgi:hypothetical protein